MFLKLPLNKRKSNNQKERTRLDIEDKQDIENFKNNIKKELKKIKSIPNINLVVSSNNFPISQKYSIYSNLPYGEIGTIKEAGCGPLALEYALRIQNYNIEFKQIVDECTCKGYRAYIYDNDNNVIDGSGTYNNIFTDIGVKLNTIKEIFEYLKKGSPVTLLINYNDTIHKNNHFVTLIGIENEKLIIMDGNLIEDDEKQSLIKLDFCDNITKVKSAWGYKKEKLEMFIKK